MDNQEAPIPQWIITAAKGWLDRVSKAVEEAQPTTMLQLRLVLNRLAIKIAEELREAAPEEDKPRLIGIENAIYDLFKEAGNLPARDKVQRRI